MRKIIGISLVILFLIGCSQSETPPSNNVEEKKQEPVLDSKKKELITTVEAYLKALMNQTVSEESISSYTNYHSKRLNNIEYRATQEVMATEMSFSVIGAYGIYAKRGNREIVSVDFSEDAPDSRARVIVRITGSTEFNDKLTPLILGMMWGKENGWKLQALDVQLQP